MRASRGKEQEGSAADLSRRARALEVSPTVAMAQRAAALKAAGEKVLDFSDPYYYTPAQMAVCADSGITSLDGLAGKVICVGAATTYLDWIGGTLDFGTESPQTTPPAGATATTQETDRLCAEAWKAGRTDADGWLSSATTVQDAIDYVQAHAKK